jgi:elongation of very long chain fatty acids protein 6
MNLPIIFPKNHEDIHINATNKQFDWFRDGRGMMWPDNHNFFVIAGFLYCPILYLSIKIMKYFKPFNLRLPLFIWNLTIGILSGIGAYKVLPWIYNDLQYNNFNDHICNHENAYTSNVAFYVAVFNATKIFEWIDTIFLVLRKKKIIFLHWFHHIITYLYCWHGMLFSYRADVSGFWFAGINMFVHAIMYSYYALTSIGIKLPISMFVTFIQTFQMLTGLILIYTCINNCDDSWERNWHGHLFASLMYFTYLILFTQIFISKYCKSKRD